MSIKTDGATWKRFYDDPEIWAGDAYSDDTRISFNGFEDDGEMDYSQVADDAVVVLESGTIVYPANGGRVIQDMVDMVKAFRAWLKKQQNQLVLIDVPKDRIDEIKALLKANKIAIISGA